MRQNYSLLTYSVEILAVIVGLLTYQKYRSTTAKYFILFLIYVLTLEIIGYYPTFFKNRGLWQIISNTVFEKNYWFYTLFWSIGSALFFIFYYRKILKSKLYKSILKYAGLIFLLSAFANIIIDKDSFFRTDLIFLAIGNLVVILLCVVLYFVEVLMTDRVLLFYKSLNFYISLTILIWWFVITPITFYEIYFSNADWSFVILKWQIKLLANIFMYLTFSLALLLCKPQNL